MARKNLGDSAAFVEKSPADERAAHDLSDFDLKVLGEQDEILNKEIHHGSFERGLVMQEVIRDEIDSGATVPVYENQPLDVNVTNEFGFHKSNADISLFVAGCSKEGQGYSSTITTSTGVFDAQDESLKKQDAVDESSRLSAIQELGDEIQEDQENLDNMNFELEIEYTDFQLNCEKSQGEGVAEPLYERKEVMQKADTVSMQLQIFRNERIEQCGKIDKEFCHGTLEHEDLQRLSGGVLVRQELENESVQQQIIVIDEIKQRSKEQINDLKDAVHENEMIVQEECIGNLALQDSPVDPSFIKISCCILESHKCEYEGIQDVEVSSNSSRCLNNLEYSNESTQRLDRELLQECEHRITKEINEKMGGIHKLEFGQVDKEIDLDQIIFSKQTYGSDREDNNTGVLRFGISENEKHTLHGTDETSIEETTKEAIKCNKVVLDKAALDSLDAIVVTEEQKPKGKMGENRYSSPEFTNKSSISHQNLYYRSNNYEKYENENMFQFQGTSEKGFEVAKIVHGELDPQDDAPKEPLPIGKKETWEVRQQECHQNKYDDYAIFGIHPMESTHIRKDLKEGEVGEFNKQRASTEQSHYQLVRSLDEGHTKENIDPNKLNAEINALQLSTEDDKCPSSGGSEGGSRGSRRNFGVRDAGIKKPPPGKVCIKAPYRKDSSINWFPRKRLESFLERKIRLLQEVEGMNVSLDQTLVNSHVVLPRVEREKRAVQEAAKYAMETRKAALVEAAWCRIIELARIPCESARMALEEAHKNASEAFDKAVNLGVVMKNHPPSNKPSCGSKVTDGKHATKHTVTASFMSPFDVEKEVAAAVKVAYVRLAEPPHTPFKEMMKLSNDLLSPRESSENLVRLLMGRMKLLSTEELASLENIVSTRGLGDLLMENSERDEGRKESDHQTDVLVKSIYSLDAEKASAMGPQSRTQEVSSDLGSVLVKCVPRWQRELEEAKSSTRTEEKKCNDKYEHQVESLDQVLVKRHSRLEKEKMQAAATAKETWPQKLHSRSAQEDANVPGLGEILEKKARVTHLGRKNKNEVLAEDLNVVNTETKESTFTKSTMLRGQKANPISEYGADLGSVLVKTTTRLERDLKDAKNSVKVKQLDRASKKSVHNSSSDQKVDSLDQVLVRHVSRLEREKMEAVKEKETHTQKSITRVAKSDQSVPGLGEVLKKQVVVNKFGRKDKDSIFDENNNTVNSKANITPGSEDSKERTDLGSVLVRTTTRLERDLKRSEDAMGIRERYRGSRHTGNDVESLDQVLVKHVSRLEKEKMEAQACKESTVLGNPVSSKTSNAQNQNMGSFDQPHKKSETCTEKSASETLRQNDAKTSKQDEAFQSRLNMRKRRELEAAWGGLGLGDSLKPHFSKLQLEQVAWREAEEECSKKL